MSATSNMSEEERQAVLLAANEANEETQMARLAALKGKTMLFIGGDFMYAAMGNVLQHQLRKLRSNGVFIYAVFQEGKEEGKYYADAKNGQCFDHAFFADIGCEHGAQAIVDKMKADEITVQYAFSFHESTQPIMAGVQTMLGLPGNPLASYEIARDKYATRRALEAAGLNTIKATPLWSPADAGSAAEHVGFPMIIKPSVGMGSAGVYKARNEEEMHAVVDRLFQDMDSDWLLNRSKVGKQAPVLAEEFVVPTLFGDGKINEFDVEVLLWDGEVKYSNVIDNWITRGDFFQEVGSSAPSLAPQDVLDELKAYAAKCVLAMGFTRGGFHVECWHTSSGPLLIEVNSRIGGGYTAGTHEAVWGVDPFFEFALTMLDVPINPPRALQPKCAYGFLLPNAEVTGRLLDKVSFLEEAEASPLFKHLTYYVKPGAQVKGLDRYVADWLGEIHLVEKTANVAELANEMDATITRVAEATRAQTLVPDLPQEE